MVAALITSFYDPLRLAEDLVVLDNISRGRVDLVLGVRVRAERVRDVRRAVVASEPRG